MWLEFYRTVAVTIALLFIPGYLFWRGLRFSPILAMCCSPIYSACMYAVLPIAYYELGIPCGVASIAGPTVAMALITYALSRRREKPGSAILAPPDQEPLRIGASKIPFDLVVPLAYVTVAALVCSLVFVRNLPHPDAFYSRYDNQTHINAVQAFVDSGKWSSLHESAFLASPVNATPSLNNTGGFYPSAWHDLNALAYLAADANVTISANAVVTVLCSLVLPLGTYAFVRALFPDRRNTIWCGAIATSMFSTWPWVFIVKGPCFPNLLGMSLMTAALGAIVTYVDGGQVLKKLPSFAIFSAVSFVALALSHPNTLFTAFIFMSAYGAHVINRAITQAARPKEKAKAILRVLLLGLYFAALVAFWLFCYKLPLLSGVLGYHWTENTGVVKALISLLSFRLIVGGTQVAVAILVLAGLITCLRNREPWLLGTPAFFSICFLACRCGWEPIKYWLSALWYMTPYRFSANISLFCIPLAALGMDEVLRLASRQTNSQTTKGAHVRPSSISSSFSSWKSVAIAVAILVVTFMPSITIPLGDGITVESSFGRINAHIYDIFTDEVEHVYSAEEVAFVNRAKELLPEGALVLNSPNDGSMWAYGVNEVNTFYRNKGTRGSEESKLIREYLNEYATNKDVQNAVKSTGAEYLLLLDKGVSFEDGKWIPQYKEGQVKAWAGINAVNDDTPGFEVVLDEGDEMRLYRIKDANTQS